MTTSTPRETWEPRLVADQYVIRSQHRAASSATYDAYTGPFTSFSVACAAADALRDHYLDDPFRIDESPCSTVISVEPLSAPPRPSGR